MSQGPLCPNLTKKVQKEVYQMANLNLSCAMLLGGLKPPKNCSGEHIFTPFCQFGLKIQNTHFYRHRLTFLTSRKLALNGPANSPVVRYSKI